MSEKIKKEFKMPHVYIILLIVMFIVVVLSWIIPSGEYGTMIDPITGKSIMDTSSFKYITNGTPIKVLDFFKAIHTGIVQSGDIVISVIIAGGVLYIFETTGALGAGIHKVLSCSKGKELLVVIILHLLFVVLGAIRLNEGTIPFFPLVVSVVMALGYDRITGVAVSQLGIAVGFTSGVLNLYTTGISQTILGLPIFSGIEFRLGALIIFAISSTLYISFYCKKIKKSPEKSIVAKEYMQQLENKKEESEEKLELNLQRKIALLLLLILFVATAYGSLNLKWGLPEFSAAYLILAIALTILFKLKPSKVCEMISFGGARILPAALVIGIARATMILMTQAKIMDTCIYKLANILNNKSALSVLLIIYIAVIAFNFFVISATGKAMIMMPILGPLGQILKINQQIMVLVYQYGDGITNYLWPSSGGLLVALSMCGVEWKDWVKFAWKFLLFWIILSFGVVLFANYINLGPF